MITTCPHCKRTLRTLAATWHYCPEDPANRNAMIVGMENPDAPGVARSMAEYSAINARLGLPSARMLQNHFGSWSATCAYFGLAIVVALCPHCNHRTQIATHPAQCVANPARYDEIRAWLADPRRPGCAIEADQYGRTLTQKGAPSAKVLRDMWGSWADVCAHFGLVSATKRARSREAAAIEDVAAMCVEARAILAQEQANRSGVAVLEHHIDAAGRRAPGPRPLPDGRKAWTVR